MSLAGMRSAQGDEYQVQIALHWVVEMLKDETIDAVQVESVGTPDGTAVPTVDDILVFSRDGKRRYIQAKKNQPGYKVWSVTDDELKAELNKACLQLEADEYGIVAFYSRTPFGDFQKLVEQGTAFSNYETFIGSAPETLKSTLADLAAVVSRDPSVCLDLCRRIQIGPYHSFDDWDRLISRSLAESFAHPEEVRDILESRVRSHQAQLREPTVLLRREQLLAMLAGRGHHFAAMRRDADILAAFERASKIGRSWVRDIGGQRLVRPELQEVIEAIETKKSTVVIVDQPGSGKTCLLLDLVDRIEAEKAWARLFIKGEHFGDATSESALVTLGLPEDIVGQCSRLSLSRRVVVIIDSLDVLSLNRNSRVLQLFLALIDRLGTIKNLTVVAACRQFDLNYDQHLRGRFWDVRVPLPPLDVESVVAPLMKTWGLDPNGMHPQLRKILSTPQYLRLFQSIARAVDVSHIASVSHLYETYFQDVIVQNPSLGEQGLAVLMDIARRLQARRTYTIPWSAFNSSDVSPQQLISENVLVEPQQGILAFSHQEMADFLVVRSAVRDGDTLAGFIKSQPALPYVRPVVRMFFFHLRTVDPHKFRRDVWTVLHDGEIAYHLRRLVAESLAEVTPGEDDVPMLLRILLEHPDLFERLAVKTTKLEWLAVLTDTILPAAEKLSGSGSLVRGILRHLARWVTERPDVVTQAWLGALRTGGTEYTRLLWMVQDGLKKIGTAESKTVRSILETAFDTAEGYERRDIGAVLQHWITETDSGDDLLWRLLDFETHGDDGNQRGLQERDESIHEYNVTPEFLNTRLCNSNWLLSKAIDLLLESISDQRDPWGMLLYDTSWRLSYRDGPHGQGLKHYLLDGIESGLEQHAKANDEWWREYESRLREVANPAVSYLLMRAYGKAPETNIEGIAELIVAPACWRNGLLLGEVCKLANIAYPLLPSEVKEAHQEALLKAVREATDEERQSVTFHVYSILEWVPCCYRLPQCRQLLELEVNTYGRRSGSESRARSNGFVGSPVSVDQLMALSEASIAMLAKYYNRLDRRDRQWGASGGTCPSQFPSAVMGASSRDPLRFIQVFDRLAAEGGHDQYLEAIVGGVANHVCYRFSNLQPDQSWQATEPLPDGVSLARWLLRKIEVHEDEWIDTHTLWRAVDACCSVVNDVELSERVTFVLARMQRHPNPHAVESDGRGIMSVALNSVRGVAAGCSIKLFNRLLEQDRPIPGILPDLLQRFAADPVQGVGAALLSGLAFTTFHRPEFGWQLFEIVMNGNADSPWEEAEWVLYHNYLWHFHRVRPWLDRLAAGGLASSGETYGRIAMLSVLAGHLELGEVCDTLASGDAKGWIGAIQVCLVNLKDSAKARLCGESLLRIVADPRVPREALRRVHFEASDDYVPVEIVLAWLRAISDDDDVWLPPFMVIEWLALAGMRNPIAAMPVMEELASYCERHREGHPITSEEKLVVVLNALLREADERDEPELIHRTIALQDRFLRLGVGQIDAMLDAASRP